MQVKCPRCGKLVHWEGNEWRPFCSERCKVIDLGTWASGEYRVPEESTLEENPEKLDGRDEET